LDVSRLELRLLELPSLDWINAPAQTRVHGLGDAVLRSVYGSFGDVHAIGIQVADSRPNS
jgi:hypothetical protein